MARALVLLCILFFVSPLKASESLLTLSTTSQLVDVVPVLEVLEDKSAQLSLPHLLDNHVEFKADWQPPKMVGYTLSAWWMRFEVLNTHPTKRSWYLQMQEAESNSVQLYAFPTANATSPQSLPAIHELRRASFLLELPQGQKYSIYLRIKNSNRPLIFNLNLLSPEALVKSTPTDHMFYAFILGGLLVMSVYNLLTFFSLKELSYFSLTIFIFSNSIGLSAQSGLLSLLFPQIDAGYVHVVASMVTIASGNRFFYHLMQLSSRQPLFANLFRVHFWLSVFFIFIIYFLPFQVLYTAVFGVILLLLAIPVLWMFYRANIPEARIFIWAFVTIVVASIPIFLYAFGVLDDWTTALNILMLGFLLFIVLLSLSQSTYTSQLREQAQRIEAAGKAKDAFLMTMSHELRTPMHAVVSSGTLLQQTALTSRQADYVSRLQVSAQHMLNLINNILDVSRLNHTQPEIKEQPFALQDILDNLEKLLGGQARQKGLEFRLTSDYHAPTLLMGDPIRLSQVLLNLLDNAVKFTDAGRVSLEVKPLGQWLSKIELQFVVTDTGIGLSLQEQERLFEPFFQANSSVSRRHSGTGLGLTISHNLVRHLGGELQFTSKPNQGSIFLFKLTFSLADQLASHTDDLQKPFTTQHDYQDKTVLLVNDDALNQFFGKELLMALGVNVELATSGKLTLSKLTQGNYDLVFMDVSMPELDGYQTTQRIRNELGLKTLPIIALTAHAIEGERERCLEAGMNDYLAKPFSIRELDTMLAYWLFN